MSARRRAHVTIDQPASSASASADNCDEAQSAPCPGAKKPSMKSTTNLASSCSLPARIARHVENIRAMRSSRDAPVDTMGCHKLHDEKTDEKTQRYQILLSLMLSAQTKDQVTHDAMVRLRQYGCTVQNVLGTPEQKIAELIRPVGMFKKKAAYIKRTTEVLVEKFDSDIPRDFKGLCSLPGVGPKMSLLALETAWGITAGIAVDTHVHRIANRLEWVDKPTRQPEQTRSKLEAIFPKEMWSEVNHLLVGFGQQICRPVHPLCDSCLNKTTCPFGMKKSSKTSPYFEEGE